MSDVAYLYKHHLTLSLRLDLYQMLFFLQQPESTFVSIFIEKIISSMFYSFQVINAF